MQSSSFSTFQVPFPAAPISNEERLPSRPNTIAQCTSSVNSFPANRDLISAAFSWRKPSTRCDTCHADEQRGESVASDLRHAPPSAKRSDHEEFEARYAIGFRPQRDLSGPREGRIGVRQQLLAIERDREAIALRTERQGMPIAGAHFDVRTGEFLAPSLHDAVEADVILERIGPREVVVVRISEAHREAPRLIHFPRHRLESCRGLQI